MYANFFVLIVSQFTCLYLITFMGMPCTSTYVARHVVSKLYFINSTPVPTSYWCHAFLVHTWLDTLIRPPRRRSITFHILNARPSLILMSRLRHDWRYEEFSWQPYTFRWICCNCRYLHRVAIVSATSALDTLWVYYFASHGWLIARQWYWNWRWWETPIRFAILCFEYTVRQSCQTEEEYLSTYPVLCC